MDKNIEKMIKEKVKKYMESVMPLSAVLSYKAFIETLDINHREDGCIEITTSVKSFGDRHMDYVSKKYGEVIVDAAGIEKSKVVFKKTELDPLNVPNKESDQIWSTNSDPLERFTWSEENYKAYLENIKEGEMTRELFFINPEGSYLQNLCLISVGINYGLQNIKLESIVKSLLGYETPVFRTRYMVAEGKNLRQVEIDMIKMALDRKDGPLLNVFYPYINKTLYSEGEVQTIEEIVKG